MIEFNDNNNIIGKNLSAPIIGSIYRGTESLRDTFLAELVDLTPYLTGGLQADETGTFNNDPSNPELIHLYTGTENQLENWNRVYVQYVEGPDLGVSTWTNPPRHMFRSLSQDGLFMLLAWGVQVVKAGVGALW